MANNTRRALIRTESWEEQLKKILYGSLPIVTVKVKNMLFKCPTCKQKIKDNTIFFPNTTKTIKGLEIIYNRDDLAIARLMCGTYYGACDNSRCPQRKVKETEILAIEGEDVSV